MALYTIPQRIKNRRGTYTELYQRNEILLEGEECFETHDVDGLPLDPWLCKVGDGSTPWNDLEYQSTGGGGGGGGDDVARINAVFDGGGVPIVVGSTASVYVDVEVVLTDWTLICDQSGSISIDVWADTYANHPPTDADSITGASPIAVAGGTKSQDSTLSDWTTTVAAGTVLYFHVDSASGVERATILLRGTKA